MFLRTLLFFVAYAVIIRVILFDYFLAKHLFTYIIALFLMIVMFLNLLFD